MTTLSLSLDVISTLARHSGSQFFKIFSSENNSNSVLVQKLECFSARIQVSLAWYKQTKNISIYKNLFEGIYFFMLTVSTYEGKHCHLTIKKNGKTAASLKDSQVSLKTFPVQCWADCVPQSVEEQESVRGRRMLSQSCVLDLTEGDTVQVAAQANSGISGKNVKLSFSSAEHSSVFLVNYVLSKSCYDSLR